MGAIPSRYKSMAVTDTISANLHYLPTPDGGRLDIGEKSISVFRREVAALNREFAAATASK